MLKNEWTQIYHAKVMTKFQTRGLYEQRHADVNVRVCLRMRDDYM